MDASLEVRCELAGHYLNHLECLAPGQYGEILGWLAWWLAEKLAVVFGSSSGVLARIRASAVQPELIRSGIMVRMTHPSIQPATLRFATRYVRSLWSLSIITAIGPRLTGLNPNNMRTEDRERIIEQLIERLTSVFPLQDSHQTTYAFDEPLFPAAESWSGILKMENPRKN